MNGPGGRKQAVKRANNLNALLQFRYTPRATGNSSQGSSSTPENESEAGVVPETPEARTPASGASTEQPTPVRSSATGWLSNAKTANGGTSTPAPTGPKTKAKRFEQHNLFSDESEEEEGEEEEFEEPSPAPTKKRLVSQDSEDSVGVPSKKKCVFQLPDSSQSNDDEGDEEEEEKEEEEYAEQMTFLREAFPGFAEEVIRKALERCDGDLDRATEKLTLESKASLKNVTGNLRAKTMAAKRSDEFNDEGAYDSEEEFLEDGQEDEDYDSEDSEAAAEVAKGSDGGKTVVDLFNTSSREELTGMSRCSLKKADLIISMRPFLSFDDLLGKVHQHRSLGFEAIASGRKLLRTRSDVTKLMTRCQKIADDMSVAVTSLGRTELDEVSAQVTRQPELLNPKLTLKPYQLVGLNWLLLIHRQDLNGILADEMGLGKTIQTIALLAQLLSEGDTGPHVIVAPSSTIDNWLRELSTWCPALEVLCYYGSQEERRHLRAQIADGSVSYHVLVTTYNMATGAAEDRSLFKKTKFRFAVFDEGHMLKNISSIRYQNLMRIRSRRRLLLTGTPLQNSLVELMSLLTFVMPQVFYGKIDLIKAVFASMSKLTSKDKPSSEEGGGGRKGKRSRFEEQRIRQCKEIMKPFVLRRLKDQVLKQLPAKTEEERRCDLPSAQLELYTDLKSRFSKSLASACSDNKSGAGMLMQLRRAANHPLLHRTRYTEDKLRLLARLICKEPTHAESVEQYVLEDMEVMSDFELHRLCSKYKNLRHHRLDNSLITNSAKFKELDKMLPDMKGRGDRVLLFSQFTMLLDVVEEYMGLRGYKYLRLDGQTPVIERQELIDRYNTEPDIFVFLLSTRAGGLGINLTAANVVILHDIDFNPYNDRQAMDRCHRLGQTKPVSVIRLIATGTIDEAMLKCGEDKLRLEREVTGRAPAKGGAGKEEEEEVDSADVVFLLRAALSDG